jgi:apolipoprotein N-acyltransferase
VSTAIAPAGIITPSTMKTRLRSLAPLAITGLLLAAAAPPWSMWPLAIIGLALWVHLIRDSSVRQRVTSSWVIAFVMFLVTLRWMTQFNIAGVVVLAALQALILAAPMAMVTKHRRLLAFPAALFLAELVRIHWPLGGFPMGGLSLGQAEGPLLQTAAIIGEPGIVFLLALLAAAIATARKRALVLASTLAVTFAGHHVTSSTTGTMNIAAVQGGGTQGNKLPDQRPDRVFAVHRTTTDRVRDPVDLIVWPENTVVVNNTIEGTPQAAALADIARTHNAYVAAGVVEYVGRRFHNAQVVWDPNGNIVDRYEKLHRVPFGEYVPMRNLIEKVADLSAVPRDVYKGSGNGVMHAGETDLGVSISYEGFFSDHARSTVRNGADVLLIPTNAASYTSLDVPRSQVNAARFRAVESRRWVVQAAPTGISLIIDRNGDVKQRSDMGEPNLLQRTVATADGQSPYVRLGNWPLGIVSALLLMWAARSGRRAQDPCLQGDEQKESD